MSRASEVERLFGLVRECLEAWSMGGASREESKALDALRDLALSLLGERDNAWALLRLVSRARHEGWYVDDPGWKPIDDAFGLGDS